MNAQEVFDVAAKALIRQDSRSMPDQGVFAYRSDDGLHSPVGHLLSDDEYSPVMERFSVYEIWAKGLLPDRLFDHLEILQDLQLVHDAFPPKLWREHLSKLAVAYGLSTAAIS